MPDFGALLADALQQRGVSLRELARLVGTPVQNLSEIARGKRKPPLARLSALADALTLTGKDRERFILAGQLAHAPEAVRDYVTKLESRKGRRSN